MQALIKENIKAPRHWFWGGTQVTDGFLVMRKMFPYDDIFMAVFVLLTLNVRGPS